MKPLIREIDKKYVEVIGHYDNPVLCAKMTLLAEMFAIEHKEGYAVFRAEDYDKLSFINKNLEFMAPTEKINGLSIVKKKFGDLSIVKEVLNGVVVYEESGTYVLTNINNASNAYANENNLDKTTGDYYYSDYTKSGSTYYYYIYKGNTSTTENSIWLSLSQSTSRSVNMHVEPHDGYLYCVGDVDNQSSIYKVNLQTKEKTQIATHTFGYNAGIRGFMFNGDYMYIFYNHYNTYTYWDYSSYVKIDLTNNTIVSSGKFLPNNSCFYEMAKVGNYAYFFHTFKETGAQSHSAYSYIYKFDPTTDTITQCNSTIYLSSTLYPNFAIIGSKIYIGKSTTSSPYKTEIYEFDPIQDIISSWNEFDAPNTSYQLTVKYSENNKIFTYCNPNCYRIDKE